MRDIPRLRRSLLLLAAAALIWLPPPTPQAAETIQFAELDANHDGRITMAEVMRYIRPAIRRGFEAMDRNHDGVLSREDFNDINEGLRSFRQWLDDLLEPFASPGERRGETREF